MTRNRANSTTAGEGRGSREAPQHRNRKRPRARARTLRSCAENLSLSGPPFTLLRSWVQTALDRDRGHARLPAAGVPPRLPHFRFDRLCVERPSHSLLYAGAKLRSPRCGNAATDQLVTKVFLRSSSAAISAFTAPSWPATSLPTGCDRLRGRKRFEQPWAWATLRAVDRQRQAGRAQVCSRARACRESACQHSGPRSVGPLPSGQVTCDLGTGDVTQHRPFAAATIRAEAAARVERAA